MTGLTRMTGMARETGMTRLTGVTRMTAMTSQIVLSTNNRVYIWQKDDEKYNPHLICSCSERKISLMIWGCSGYDGVGTLTAVEGNINSAKYIEILDKNLRPVVVWYFEGKEY